ncbi:MAG TPA: D-alanine--D-alanine ligase family protein [Cyclobacteriaceae bacterium]|nr:D-alanine--D-alanine ligase family protein [Cyclobacteriaceae bacterium]
MQKKTVAILYGGRSVEHGVSVNSAKNIFEFLDRKLFEVVPIGISKQGKWFLTAGVNREIDAGQPLGVVLDPGNGGIIILSSTERINIDIIFPVLHGTDGEDGSIQGLIKVLDIPMVGTGVLGSAISMNKIVSKRLLKEAGIPVNRFLTFSRIEKDRISYSDITRELGSPFMLKSASLGSSVGISKVKTENDFHNALEDSFSYDQEVLAEEFITGREIECAILGNNPPEASYPGEIVISPKYEFYTFEAKYVDGEAVRIEVPADLPKDTAEKLRKVSLDAYRALHCEDFARVDLFLTADGSVYVNEINTIPGFTNSSMYPMMWKERGMDFSSLITRLINLALERHQHHLGIERDFQSSLKF